MGTTEKGTRIIKLFLKLCCLPKGSKLKASVLVKEFGVSRKTIYRDVDVLCRANVPVYYQKGICLLDSFDFFYRPQLSRRELIGLMSLLEIPGKQEQYPYINEINSIKEKLTYSLLEDKKEYLENMINKVEMEIDNYYPMDQDTFDSLEKAMEIKKVVELEYYSVDRDEVNMRRFNPFAVYFKKHGWYTAGYCHLREGIRQFRLDRIKNINLTDDTYEIPEDFSVEQFLVSSWELFQSENKPVDIKVKFTGRSARIVKSGQRHHTQKIEEFNDGSIIFSVTLGDWKEFSFWVAGYGAEAEVLEPEEMRNFMIEQARKVLEVYGENF